MNSQPLSKAQVNKCCARVLYGDQWTESSAPRLQTSGCDYSLAAPRNLFPVDLQNHTPTVHIIVLRLKAMCQFSIPNQILLNCGNCVLPHPTPTYSTGCMPTPVYNTGSIFLTCLMCFAKFSQKHKKKLNIDTALELSTFD